MPSFLPDTKPNDCGALCPWKPLLILRHVTSGSPCRMGPGVHWHSLSVDTHVLKKASCGPPRIPGTGLTQSHLSCHPWDRESQVLQVQGVGKRVCLLMGMGTKPHPEQPDSAHPGSSDRTSTGWGRGAQSSGRTGVYHVFGCQD